MAWMWLAMVHGLFPFRAVAVLWSAVVVEFPARPEQAAGDEVEVFRGGHRRVGVTEGGGEDAGVFVGVHPGDDVVFLRVLAVGLRERGAVWREEFVLVGVVLR